MFVTFLSVSLLNVLLCVIFTEKLCIEDYIELQEIIIPAVVGGILALLLTVIFLSYFISFVRRKRKEGRYETLGEGY